jgi:hypothetical protein
MERETATVPALQATAATAEAGGWRIAARSGALVATRTAFGLSPDDLIVSITENGAADWSFGGGVAQFLIGALPQPD